MTILPVNIPLVDIVLFRDKIVNNWFTDLTFCRVS